MWNNFVKDMMLLCQDLYEKFSLSSYPYFGCPIQDAILTFFFELVASFCSHLNLSRSIPTVPLFQNDWCEH